MTCIRRLVRMGVEVKATRDDVAMHGAICCAVAANHIAIQIAFFLLAVIIFALRDKEQP